MHLHYYYQYICIYTLIIWYLDICTFMYNLTSWAMIILGINAEILWAGHMHLHSYYLDICTLLYNLKSWAMSILGIYTVINLEYAIMHLSNLHSYDLGICNYTHSYELDIICIYTLYTWTYALIYTHIWAMLMHLLSYELLLLSYYELFAFIYDFIESWEK